jgi:hypothetical protein
MDRYAAHVLQPDSPKARPKGANPKSKKATPKPNVMASKTARKMKNGICPEVGATPISAGGGQRMGPVIMAGIATTKVTNRTLSQVFTMLLLLFRSRVLS